MDRSEKNRRKQQWKAEQRAKARAALPLADAEMEAMFDHLDQALGSIHCDHTRGQTEAWLRAQGHAVEQVFAWLDENGGFCDCEVLANSEQAWREATGRA